MQNGGDGIQAQPGIDRWVELSWKRPGRASPDTRNSVCKVSGCDRSLGVQESVWREAPKERGLHVRRGFLIPSLGQRGVTKGFPQGSNLTDMSHFLLSLDGEGGWAVGIFSVFLIDG